jgi:hypothetical protein
VSKRLGRVLHLSILGSVTKVDANHIEEVSMKSPVLSNNAPSSSPDMTQPEVPTDDEFDEITDRMSRIILVRQVWT